MVQHVRRTNDKKGIRKFYLALIKGIHTRCTVAHRRIMDMLEISEPYLGVFYIVLYRQSGRAIHRTVVKGAHSGT